MKDILQAIRDYEHEFVLLVVAICIIVVAIGSSINKYERRK